VTQIYQK